MPDASPELNLALAVGGDDTAAYLRNPSTSLRSSLLVLDGLFNQSTGHTHSGAHQGGALAFQNLTVGANLNVVGTSDQHGIGHFYSALTVDGVLTLGSNLVVAGGTTVQGLTVSGSQTIAGSLNVGSGGIVTTGAADIGTSLHVAGPVGAGPILSGVPGDLSVSRGSNQGYIWLGNSAHYFGFDGSNYQLTGGGNLYVQGDRVVTENAGQALANKTLTTPTINGVVTWNTAQTLPAASKIGGLNIATVVGASDSIIDYGGTPLVSVPNGGLANQSYSFNRAFSAPPQLIVSLGFFSGATVSLYQIQVAAHNVTASGFQIDFANATGGTQTVVATWIAIGR